MLILVKGAAGVFNPIILYDEIPNSVTSGIAYLFQYVFSLYSISFILTLLSGIGFFYALTEIKKRWKIIFSSLYIFSILFIMISVILLPPINLYSGFNYPYATSLTPVISPLTDLSNFFASHDGWYNVLISPSQWPGYIYNNSIIIPTVTTFGGKILPPGVEIIGGLGGPVDPILFHFPSPGYNFTNFFLLGIKYVIINTHGYPGPGVVLDPPYANGFSGSSFNVSGMEYMLNQEGAKLVAKYSLFLIYQLPSNVKMIYTSTEYHLTFHKPT